MGERANLLVSEEARRSGRSRSVVVEELAEEAAKARLHPGIAFRGRPRRAWVIGSGLDVWEIVELATAAADQRILVTHNIRDFPAILRDWAAAQRTHAGVILVYGIDHRDFDVIVRGIERRLQLYQEPASWSDLAVVVDRESAGG